VHEPAGFRSQQGIKHKVRSVQIQNKEVGSINLEHPAAGGESTPWFLFDATSLVRRRKARDIREASIRFRRLKAMLPL
jgi:hypothetical protein